MEILRPDFLLVAASLLLAAHSFATPAITGVTAQQRYPWNGKVDIAYTVSGSGDIAASVPDDNVAVLKVTATDGETGETYAASSLSGDTSLADGTHAIVWDMAADGLAFKSTNVVFSVSCETTPATYCVIDLSAGASATSYPVTYLASPPSGGFNVDAYKTTKLVLKAIAAGTFLMGDDQTDESHRVTLTKPFFIGLFEVTQRQWSLVTGGNPSNFSGDKRPVEKVSYNAIRGSSDGAKWPASNGVDSDSFLGRLRARTGLDFDLPTEAQWEYACRAGTTAAYNNGGSTEDDLKSLGRYSGNRSDGKGGYTQHTTVGSYLPNAWGLYDMHGNVYEWCLDCYGTLAYGSDPKGSSSGSYRVLRGGSWNSYASSCTSSLRGNGIPSQNNGLYGFRLARALEK